MSWGFEVGRVYSRQADIHAKYGGQEQVASSLLQNMLWFS
jgi:hypothetical protein